MACKKRKRGLLFWLAVVLCMTACGEKDREEAPETPRETAEYVMESLQNLDLESLNQYTDNCIRIHRNLFGIPTRAEYQVFQELQQPGLIKGKQYQWNYKLAQKLMERMTWEIKEVRDQEREAEIDLVISNLDMEKVMGAYMVSLLETMVDSDGLGLRALMKEINSLLQDKEKLLNLMEAQGDEERCTREVTVRLSREEDQWRLHLSPDFINAILGNMSGESLPEDLERRIEELERQYERKMEEELSDFEEQAEDWVERYFGE